MGSWDCHSCESRNPVYAFQLKYEWGKIFTGDVIHHIMALVINKAAKFTQSLQQLTAHLQIIGLV